MDIATVERLTIGSIPFAARTGMTLEAIEAGYVRMKIPLQPNVNHIGTMYAGALFTLAEIPGGAVFMASFDFSRFYPIIKEMNIRFRRPARTDITVEARLAPEVVQRVMAEAEEIGKSDFILEEELKDDSGEVVAIARGVYQARRIGS